MRLLLLCAEVTADDVRAFIKPLLAQAEIELLGPSLSCCCLCLVTTRLCCAVHGNVTKQEALDVAKMVRSINHPASDTAAHERALRLAGSHDAGRRASAAEPVP